jgi:hypothetical protein
LDRLGFARLTGRAGLTMVPAAFYERIYVINKKNPRFKARQG